MIEKIRPNGNDKFYSVGHKVGLNTVDRIEEVSKYLNGDPFGHYVGYDKNGKELFSINILFPCEIEYT